MIPLNENTLAAELRACGISPSPQRLSVLGFLKSHAIHPTADMIMKALKPQLPTLSLTTVYNTLKLFVEKKLVTEVIIEDGELRFDADVRPHAHFKCRSCSKVFDLFPSRDNPEPVVIPPLPAGFTVDTVHLCLRGRCAGCGDK